MTHVPCARRSRIARSALLVVQELENFIPVVAFVDQTDVLGCDAPLAVENK